MGSGYIHIYYITEWDYSKSTASGAKKCLRMIHYLTCVMILPFAQMKNTSYLWKNVFRANQSLIALMEEALLPRFSQSCILEFWSIRAGKTSTIGSPKQGSSAATVS